jgi:hypothetical protein
MNSDDRRNGPPQGVVASVANVAYVAPVELAGIAGDWATAVQPYTEADPIGIQIAYLVAAGNMIGPTPHMMVGPRRHGVNEYAVLNGPTATGRKGDALEAGMLPARRADPEWGSERIKSGFGSGEGVIRHVQDATEEEPVHDRRLLMREGELASVLTVAARDGSTLGGLLRNAWDGETLENHTKGQSMRATGAHVSILACVTPEELRRKLTANRCSERIREPLPLHHRPAIPASSAWRSHPRGADRRSRSYPPPARRCRPQGSPTRLHPRSGDALGPRLRRRTLDRSARHGGCSHVQG